MKKLLSVIDLSEMLNIKRSTIYQWTCNKRIPYYKIGKVIRFKEDDIEKWLTKKKQKEYRFEDLNLPLR